MLSYRILIFGMVQGVGYRPFVFNLALRHNVNGFVKNNNGIVEILAQGSGSNINDFICAIYNQFPQNAVVKAIEMEEIKEFREFSDFSIHLSSKTISQSTINAIIPHDLSICKECQKEIENSRRRDYAFINCINCGPRYSIFKNFPYDRVNTAMSEFKMCHECRAEYDNPLDRRFHAQPNSCPKCAISLLLYDNVGNRIFCADEIASIKKLLFSGKIIALKGIGGFNLVCKVNFELISKLRLLKKREKKPFALMFYDKTILKKYFNLSQKEEELLESSFAPIVLLKDSARVGYRELPSNLSVNGIGVVLAYSPLHKLLLRGSNEPIVFTSANAHGNPIQINIQAMLKDSYLFDYLLDYNREIINSIDDSVGFVLSNNDFVMLRCGRGKYPLLKNINHISNQVILSLGANAKNQISLYFQNTIITSPYLGDFENLEVLNRARAMIKFLLKIYNLNIDIILCDMHPQYSSVKLAKELSHSLNVPLYGVYHHKAHFYSAYLDNDCSGSALGVVFDGSGYGEDGTIWGGEFFLFCNGVLERINHFQYFPLLGGETAIRDIKKVTLGILLSLYGEEIPLDKNKFEHFDIYCHMYKNNINSPLTSSVGRIFDVVAYLCGLEYQSYEGHSGAYIESLYDEDICDFYEYEINNCIDLKKIINCMIIDHHTRRQRMIASKFINTLVEIVLQMALRYNLPVIFSGGVFQNRILCDRILEKFKQHNIDCYMHKDFTTNDGGISLGQIGAYINNDKVRLK